MQKFLDLVSKVMTYGEDRATRNGNTRALFSEQLRFDLSAGFPATTAKRLQFLSVLRELLWFLQMRDRANVKDLQNMGCSIWDANAAAPAWLNKGLTQFEGDMGRIYGVQWNSWLTPNGQTINQINELVKRLKQDPTSRYHIVTAWNPSDIHDMALPPCHLMFQVYVHNDGRLSLDMTQRSCDLFLGVPFNIASYALLAHMLAQVTGHQAGELIVNLKDVHIYHEHFDAVNTMLTRKPLPLPTLLINPTVSDIYDFVEDDFGLEGYQNHGPITAKMLV